MADREELSWDEFGAATRQLAASVRTDGFAPDLILAIARGGLFIAGALGYALDVKNVHMMNVEYYTGVDQRLDAPVMLPPLPNVADLGGALTLHRSLDRLFPGRISSHPSPKLAPCRSFPSSTTPRPGTGRRWPSA